MTQPINIKETVQRLRSSNTNGDLCDAAAALIERLAGALEELAGDDLYMRYGSTWHDVAKLEKGVKEFARKALSGEPTQ